MRNARATDRMKKPRLTHEKSNRSPKTKAAVSIGGREVYRLDNKFDDKLQVR
jgi:hypothetical protein